MPLAEIKTWKCRQCVASGVGRDKTHARRHATENKGHQVDFTECYVWVEGRHPNYNGLQRG